MIYIFISCHVGTAFHSTLGLHCDRQPSVTVYILLSDSVHTIE